MYLNNLTAGGAPLVVMDFVSRLFSFFFLNHIYRPEYLHPLHFSIVVSIFFLLLPFWVPSGGTEGTIVPSFIRFAFFPPVIIIIIFFFFNETSVIIKKKKRWRGERYLYMRARVKVQRSRLYDRPTDPFLFHYRPAKKERNRKEFRYDDDDDDDDCKWCRIVLRRTNFFCASPRAIPAESLSWVYRWRHTNLDSYWGFSQLVRPLWTCSLFFSLSQIMCARL